MGGHVNCSDIMINGFLARKLVPVSTGCREGWRTEKAAGKWVGTTPILFSLHSHLPSHSLFSAIPAVRFQF